MGKNTPKIWVYGYMGIWVKHAKTNRGLTEKIPDCVKYPKMSVLNTQL